MYAKICVAIHHAMDTLPDKIRGKNIQRKVSETTKQLFEKRQSLKGKGTAEQFKEVQGQIKTSSLKDFENWVGEWAEVITAANGKGDTRGIYKAVKTLASKRE